MLLRGKPITIIIFAVIVLTLASYAYLGTFVRIVADDYCTAAEGMLYGVWGGITRQYSEWSGMYSNFFLKYALATYQPAVHALMPSLIIVGWFLACYVLFSQIMTTLGLVDLRFVAILLSLLMTFIMVNGAPSPQDVYWYGATIPYVIPVILLTAYVGGLIWFFRSSRSQNMNVTMIVAHIVVIGILCGFVEIVITYLFVLQVVGLIACSLILPDRRKLYIVMLVAGIIVCFVVMIFAVNAPGVGVRREALLTSTGFEGVSLWGLSVGTVVFTALFLIAETYGLAHALYLFLIVLSGGILYLKQTPDSPLLRLRNRRRIAVVSGIAGLLLIMSTVAPGIYAQGYVTARTLVLARFTQMSVILVWAILFASYLIDSRIIMQIQRSRLYRTITLSLVGLFVVLPAISIFANVARIDDFRQYARDWDARHQQLTATSSGDRMTVKPLGYDLEDYLLLLKIDTPSTWVNTCASRYYQLEEIIVE